MIEQQSIQEPLESELCQLEMFRSHVTSFRNRTTEQVETLPSIPVEVVPNRTKCPYGCRVSINPEQLKEHQQECFGKVARLPVLAEYAHILKYKIDGYQFMVVLPREYNDSKQPIYYPALLFLHGRGEQGTNFEKMNNISIFKQFTTESFPFITIIPQSPRGEAGWLLKKLNKIMKFVMQEFRVDQNRIYGTGLAMGAYGLMKFAAAYPEMFAALVPVCGGIDINDAPKLAHIPIWATHTDNDSIVPVSTSVNMMKAISLAGSQDNKLTVFEPYRFRTPFEDHDAWTETYENPQIYLWMLSHAKGPQSSQVEKFKEAINKLSISQRVRVKFIIEHKVHWQEQLAVVGSIPELGSWNASEAVKMFWNQDNVWSVEVIVPRKYANFEWKFVILKNNDVAWESRQNRWFELNDQCHVTLNNKWNEWYNCVLYKRFSFCTIFKLDYIAKPTFTSLGDSSLSKYRDKL